MRNLIIILFLFFISSCASSRFVKPLDKKRQAVNVSLGGPLIAFKSITIPTPFLTATYGYGIDSTLTGFVALNVTSAIYGNLQMEAGAVKRLIRQRGHFPAISITPVANIIYRNKDAHKFYPQLMSMLTGSITKAEISFTLEYPTGLSWLIKEPLT